MKGVIFTEFIELVENQFGLETADRVITRGCPFHGGYTSVGNYDYRQLLSMVSELSTATGVEVPGLVKAFGGHLFGRFLEMYPELFANVHCTADLLRSVEYTIHVEVRKLSPDAELPSFEFDTSPDNHFAFVYRSKRPFAVLAEGIIEASLKHYGEDIVLQREDLDDRDGRAARFTFKPRVAKNESEQSLCVTAQVSVAESTLLQPQAHV